MTPGQPGDIDVIIVPTYKHVPDFSRAMAIEVKRLALRGPNWERNVDRYGITQALGLARAGFPYVGILHLVLNRPGPERYFKEMLRARVIDEFGHIEFLGKEIVDMTGMVTAERQMARLLSQEIPPFIGLNAVVVQQRPEPDGRVFYGHMDSTPRIAQRNPKVSPILLENLEYLFEAYWPIIKQRPADIRDSRKSK